MSTNKNANKNIKTTASEPGKKRRLEKEKQNDTRKIKKEETRVSVKNVKSTTTTTTTSKNNVTNDVDIKKKDVKSVTSSNVIKRTKPTTNTTMKAKSSTYVDTPSKRVVKTQYFPSKDMISNVVRGKLKTNNINDVKKLKEPIKKVRDSSQIRKPKDEPAEKNTERPRTATLRRSSILNVNLPDVSSPSPKQSEENYDYDDDFDSYESDFEEYKSSSSSSSSPSSSISDIPSVGSHGASSSSSSTSLYDNTTPTQKTNLTDEERKLDSGNYELNVESKHKQLLDNIKESVEQENAAFSNLTSLSDEGFEDGKSMNQTNNFINFLDARKKCIRRKSLAQRKKRGDELLNMIKLDNQNFTLLDIPAISYDDYIQIYGNKSGHQVSSQTGEDNVEETTQTEEEQTVNKWTQYPIYISKTVEFERERYLMELHGCGNDMANVANKSNENVDFDRVSLTKFLTSVEEIVLQLLDKNSRNDTILIKSELPFSDEYVPIRFNDTPLLKNKDVVYVTFSQVDETKFLTVHNSHDNDENVICVWNTIRPIGPEKILKTYGKVTCCCFGLDSHRIIFGALNEGSIAIWSLDETIETSGETEISIRPNFVTSINNGHVDKVIAVQALIDNSDDVWKKSGFEMKSSSQICSLDESGTLIIWSVIIKSDDRRPLKSVALTQNSTVTLNEVHSNLRGIQCTDMTINLLDLNHVYVSTNYGYILHYMINGTKAIPNKYVSDKSPSTSLITCPFSSQYFASSQENGKIVFYSRTIENSLKELEIVEDDVKINIVQWSYTKPFVFYSIDNKNNLYVWDLSKSDLYPTHTVRGPIKFVRLSPANLQEETNNKNYMMIVKDDNSIDLHLLNDEYGRQNSRNYQEDVNKFLNYINRF